MTEFEKEVQARKDARNNPIHKLELILLPAVINNIEKIFNVHIRMDIKIDVKTGMYAAAIDTTGDSDLDLRILYWTQGYLFGCHEMKERIKIILK